MSSNSFNSKILLFGEYSVIKDSMALSIPYSLFEGRLNFKRDADKVIDPELKAFSRYLKEMETKGKMNFDFDIASFEFDVSQGLIFDSSIPQGFGVGSSGALCAALYDRYAIGRDNIPENISILKNNFSILESHFHGSSSGIDPLISYLNRPILLNKNKEIGPVELPIFQKNGNGAIFLLNTGRSRKTEPLVNLFLEKCKTKRFNHNCFETLLPVTNKCIQSFLEDDFYSLYKAWDELSLFQMENFTPMIPKLFLDVWNQGLSTDQYSLKLCGAGGGGFILGITKDFKIVTQLLQDFEVRPLFRF